LEEARTEWMRARGRSYRDVEAGGNHLMIAELSIQYLAPCRYDDQLEISVRELGRRRVRPSRHSAPTTGGGP
jgi:acyl-CoA thioesterase FadM